MQGIWYFPKKLAMVHGHSAQVDVKHQLINPWSCFQYYNWQPLFIEMAPRICHMGVYWAYLWVEPWETPQYPTI